MDDTGDDSQPTRGARADVSPRPGSASPGPVGWYPDPWSIGKRRYWTGESWTAWTTDATTDAAQPAPAPLQPPPPPPQSSLPPVPPPFGARPTAEDKNWSRKTLALVVAIGLIVGAAGAFILHGGSSSNNNTNSAAGQSPSGNQGPGTTVNPRQGQTPNTSPVSRDPMASALGPIVLQQADVTGLTSVALIGGGNTLADPTLDLCNGNFPSESLRTARLQVASIDSQGNSALSTEAVLYSSPTGGTQAFSELQKVSAACPSTPVTSPVGEPTVITHFNAPPDGSWPQTATVSRLAYDFTSTDDTGVKTHSIAVYLQRGRVLMGIYFLDADTPPGTIAGQTTVPGIVGVFASRIAALPTSVTG